MKRIFLSLAIVMTVVPLNVFADGGKVEITNLRVKPVPFGGGTTHTEIQMKVDVENKSQERLQKSLCMELVDADGFQIKYRSSDEARLVPGKKVTVGPSIPLALRVTEFKKATNIRVYWGLCIADPKNQDVSNVLIKKIDH